MPGLLMAALFLVTRLLASSMAMAAPPPDAITAATVFCHSDLGDDAPQAPAHDHACLICPACHVVSHASLPMPAPAVLPIGLGGDIGQAAALPPSTGPPHRPRVSAHPTGPPPASI